MQNKSSSWPKAWSLACVVFVVGCGGAGPNEMDQTSEDNFGGRFGNAAQAGTSGLNGGVGGNGVTVAGSAASAGSNQAPPSATPLAGGQSGSSPVAPMAPAAGGNNGPGAQPAVPSGKPTFVAVGSSGRRVRSLDLGRTWTDDQKLGGGGDDEYLLRSVTYGAGRFVAAGWKILSSTDGKTWTEHKNPVKQWLGGVEWGNGRFAATGGYGYALSSSDGMEWTPGKGCDTEASRSLAFGNGKFMTGTDSGNWWSSTDGTRWSRAEAGRDRRLVFCDTQFSDASACKTAAGRNGGRTAFGAGVWVSVRGTNIERSEDGGISWTTINIAGSGLEDVAFGYTP